MGVDGSFFQSYCCLSDHNPAAAAKKGHKASKCSYLGLQSGKKKKTEQKKPGRSSAGFLSLEKAGADFHTEQGNGAAPSGCAAPGLGDRAAARGALGVPAGRASPSLLTARPLPVPSPGKSPRSGSQPRCTRLAPSLRLPQLRHPKAEGCSIFYQVSDPRSSACTWLWCPCAASQSGIFLDVLPAAFQAGFQVQHTLAFPTGRDGAE